MRRLVVLGFGAIGVGLYVREAAAAGSFAQITALVRRPAVADAVAAAGGTVTLNTATTTGVVAEVLGPVAALGEADRPALVAALAGATDIAVAVGSVADYATGLAALLAEGLRAKAAGGPKAVVYASENHNDAAALLDAAIGAHVPPPERAAVAACHRTVDTVIGKMSRVVRDPAEIAAAGLLPLAPGLSEAVLVEAFNAIRVGRPRAETGAGLVVGFPVFSSHDDLRPFEHAKLYGHNAAHAAMAYLGRLAGATFIADVATRPALWAWCGRLFREECGAALVARHGGADPLFTRAGMDAHVADLLSRMANPYLRDTVERVGRDPARKLGADDRLVGALRFCLAAGVRPRRLAVATLAAADALRPGADPAATLADLLAHTPEAAEAEAYARQEAVTYAGVAASLRAGGDLDAGLLDAAGLG